MKRVLCLLMLAEAAFCAVGEPIPFRGVVEGYYGRPWGTGGRLSLRKMYAAKHKGASFDAADGFRGFSAAKAIANPQVTLTQDKYAGYERILNEAVEHCKVADRPLFAGVS